MTNEEMERAIGFLIESQAKHDAQIAELRGMVIETNRVVRMMAESGAEFNSMVTRAIADLAAAQQQTQAQLRDTDARLRDTDARLNAVINVVERLAGGS